MHAHFSEALEAFFSASERRLGFLGREKGECFNLFPSGWVYGGKSR
jgi:hypothetical protein